MDSSPAGSSTGTFNCGVRDDGGVEIIGWFGGLLPFNTPKPSPLGVPSSYLLVHQFRLHTAWQLGDSAGRRRQGGCVRDWKLGETKSRHCLGRSELLRGIEESGCLRAFEIHQKPLSSPIITGALGLVPITPKGGNWSLVSRDVEIPRGPTPLLFFFFSLPCHRPAAFQSVQHVRHQDPRCSLSALYQQPFLFPAELESK